MVYPRTKLDLEIEKQKKRGILLVISGPSGTGKDAVANGFKEKHKLGKIVTYTTRPQRPGERKGFDYFFISPSEFEEKRKKGFFLEWEKYLDNFYGTPKNKVKEALQSGKDVVLRIDVRGAKSVKKTIPQAVLVYLATPSFNTMAKRLSSRNREDREEIKRKLQIAAWEVEQFEGFDYLLVNEQGKLEETIKKVKMILEAERRKVRK